MKPASMKKFDALYLGSIAVGLVGFAVGYGALVEQANAELAANGLEGAGGGLLIAGVLFGVAVNLALWFLVSVLRIGFVKWILGVFVVWGALSLAVSATSDQAGAGGGGIVLAFGILGTLLAIASLYFLFQPDAKAWLAAKRNDGRPDNGLDDGRPGDRTGDDL